jgi:hypothetical protein
MKKAGYLALGVFVAMNAASLVIGLVWDIDVMTLNGALGLPVNIVAYLGMRKLERGNG